MRARLIIAFALGSSALSLAPARADEFDDDFGTLPPAPVAAPQPQAAPSPAAPTPSAPAVPEPSPAPEAHGEVSDPWQGSYPPLDEDSPPPLPDARRTSFVHPTIEGLVGGVHTVDAASAAPRSFRVGITGSFFRRNGFLSENDHARRGSGILSLNVTPIDHLELAANVTTHVTENRNSDPQLVQVVGDSHLFAKGFARVLPWLAVGGDVELALLNAVGGIGVAGRATSVGLRGNVSADLRALPRRALPLILRGNLRYLFDNSGKLADDIERDRHDSLANAAPRGSEYRGLLTPAERYALGIHRTDQLAMSFGLEVPLHPHERWWIAPILEWSFALPVNRQGFDCIATRIPGQRDGCAADRGFGARPSRLTMGVRAQPYLPGLGVLLAVDVATSGARDFVRELAPESRYMVHVGLSYAYDTRRRAAARPRVQRIEIPASDQRGHILGMVVDAQTGAPLPDAIVHFEGTSLSDVVSDENGSFRSAELSPGAQGMRVRLPGYREALCVAVLPSPGSARATQGNDVSARCELTPSEYFGSLEGRIHDSVGKPVADARITLHGPTDTLLVSDGDGRFAVPKLPEGSYELSASADGHFSRRSTLVVARGQPSTPSITLIPRAQRPGVRLNRSALSLLRPVAFAPDTAILLPASDSLLAELAEVLQKHPELAQVEIQAHGEDGPVAIGQPPLTQQRADAVRGWLINAGVAPERLSAKGYGQSRPLVPNITPQNRNRNRRIQLRVLKP